MKINLGILIYNNYPIVRKDLSIPLLLRIFEIDNIVGIKECTPNF